MEYTIAIRKAPDGFYIASCPLILEAHAQGNTYDECMTNIKEALELCLEYRKERGEEIPQEVNTPKVTDTSQAYFWTEEWQKGERKADEDIKSGRVKRFKSSDEAIKYLEDKPPRPPR